jgi:hypothetical protein
MDLLALGILVCKFLIGFIVLCGIVYLAIYIVKMFVEIPPLVERAVWLIVLLIVIIAVLSLIAGGGTHVSFPAR